MSNLTVSIHKGLLVHPANALKRSNEKGVLRAKITGMSGFNFTAGNIGFFLFLKGNQLRLRVPESVSS